MMKRSLVAFAAATPGAASMQLSTRFTNRYSATSPIILAPMGGCAGGALAASVSAAGGIGLVGSGGETLDFLRKEWEIALAHPTVERSRLGFGLNVNQLEEYSEGTLQRILQELQPAHVYLSFGDIAPHAAAVIDSGAALYSNAGDSEGALAHARAGASCVVVQGSDAGGHTHSAASVFTLVPQARSTLDAAGFEDTLLVAAGGISDGRGLAATLVLGADAAILGTRLAAAAESTYTQKQKDALVSVPCGAAGTGIGTFIDTIRGIEQHSSGLPGRCLINRTTQLEADWATAGDARRLELMRMHQDGVAAAGGEGLEWGATWAGTAVGLVNAVQPAEDIVREVVDEAVCALNAGAAKCVGGSRR
jgi:nitronate monooxygenase